MRLTRPVSTLPGPTSTKRSMPPRAIHEANRLHPTHRTVDLADQGVARRLARATGMRVDVGHHRRSAGRERRGRERSVSGPPRAGRMSGEWKGADTGSGRARLAPRSLASAIARSTAAACPAITVCSGRVVVRDRADFARGRGLAATSSTAVASRPRIAAIAPTPTGTASCIRSPRRRTSRTASAKSSAPAATSAEYSPRLWPATQTRGRTTLRSATARSDRHRRGQDRGLGVGGQLQLASAGPSKQSRDSGFAERRVGLGERRGGAAGRPPPRPCPCRPSASPGRETRKRSSSLAPDLGAPRSRASRGVQLFDLVVDLGVQVGGAELDRAANRVLDRARHRTGRGR